MSLNIKGSSPLVSPGRICASVQLHPVRDGLAHPVVFAFLFARRAL